MTRQYLPTYTHRFEHDPRWETLKSKHYIFHYFPNSVAEKDMGYIREKQELVFRKVLNFLHTTPPDHPIEYFFYPDKKTKIKLMGDGWYAQSIYNEFRIHALYTKKDKPIGEHEDTHLLSLPWGLSIGFFQEGLAEFMVGHAWDGNTHAQYVREGYKKKFFPFLKRLMTHRAWMEKSEVDTIYFYSLAGAFINYLVQEYGKKKFESLYKNTHREYSANQNIAIFSSIYRIDIDEMEYQFKQKISIV